MGTLRKNDPQWLQETAERAFGLASTTLDASVHDALTLYGQGLLALADKIEAKRHHPERY